MFVTKLSYETMLIYFQRTLRSKLEWNVTQISNIFIEENVFENVVCKMAAILSLGRNMLRNWNWNKHG